MRRFQIYLLVCFLVSSCFAQREFTQSHSLDSSIIGVWKVERSEFRFPDSAWSIRAAPYESLYIFTKEYYSYSYVLGASPRKLFAGDPNKPTDAEKISTYESFVSNSGTYV